MIDLHSPPQRTISTLLHVAGLLLFAAEIAWLPNITNPLHNGFGGSHQFLTIIALTASATTFALGLLADLTLNKSITTLKTLLALCVTPLDVLVSVLYWTRFAIDQSRVVPPGHAVPLLPNFGFHAMPAVLLTLDLMLVSPPWTIGAGGAMALGTGLAFLYWAWLEYCFSFNGWYPYPGLMPLSVWEKGVLFVGSAGLMTGCTMGLKGVYGRIHGVEEREKKTGAFDGTVKRD